MGLSVAGLSYGLLALDNVVHADQISIAEEVEQQWPSRTWRMAFRGTMS